MTDLERIELAIRRTAQIHHDLTLYDLEDMLMVLADQISVERNKAPQGHSAKVDP